MFKFSESSCFTTERGVPIYRYGQVTNSGSGSMDIELSFAGDWFIVDARSTGYFHYMFDSIGQFYAIKTIVPDLKPLILVPNKSIETDDIPDFVWWSIEKLLVEDGATVVEDHLNKSFTIENLYIASNELIVFFDYMNIQRTNILSFDRYQDLVAPELRKFFLRNLTIDEIPSKIYMSRKSKSSQLNLEKEYLDYLKLNNVSWKSILSDDDFLGIEEAVDPRGVIDKHTLPAKFKDLPSWNKNPAFLELEIHDRYMSDEDETKLERFFEESGYKIFSHGGLSYEEQMSIIAGASHFATLIGSSSINSIACREDANIYILNHNTNNSRVSNHEYLPSIVFNNTHVVFSYNEHPNKIFYVDELIDKLKEIGV